MRPSELRKAARDPHNVELIEAAAAFAELKSSGTSHKGVHCLTEESMSGYYLECEGARYGV